MKITFVVLTEFLKYQHIYSLLKMVSAAQAKHHEIRGVFFFGTGVLNINKAVKLGKNTINVPSLLGELAKTNVKMYACQTWADNYGIFPENTVEGIEIVGLGELSDLTAECDKLVVFGSHA
jgi:sulfur relay (sulfurtransferase) complex TusBCD TusD component (DsrE family)